jgi:hypothetical protein
MSAISIGKESSAKHQFLAFLYYMSNKDAQLFFPENESRVTINENDVDRCTDIDWDTLKSVYPFSRYVDMTERNLDLQVTPEDISPYVYHGMRSLGLFCFVGYLKIALEWNDEYELVMAQTGDAYIRECLVNYGDHVVSKRLVFLKFENGQTLCAQLVNVSLKPREPVKPFLTGCGWLMSQKFMRVGIYAVIFKFNTIPNPFDCVVYTKANLNSLPVSTHTHPNLLGSADTGENCMITRFSTLVEEVQELSFDLELEEVQSE